MRVQQLQSKELTQPVCSVEHELVLLSLSYWPMVIVLTGGEVRNFFPNLPTGGLVNGPVVPSDDGDPVLASIYLKKIIKVYFERIFI